MNIIFVTLILMLAFMLFDIVTGLAAAFKNKTYQSTKMREGLWHKLGYILAVAFAALIEYGCKYIDIGISLPILVPVMVYIIICEIGSILENINEITPNALPKKIHDALGQIVNENKKQNDESESGKDDVK